MTTVASTAPIIRRQRGFDLSKPVLAAFAVILIGLIALPLSWLVFYAFKNKSGGFTLDNFYRLATDAAYLDPLLTTFALAMLSGAAVMQNLTIIFSGYTGGQDGLNGLDPIVDSTLAY